MRVLTRNIITGTLVLAAMVAVKDVLLTNVVGSLMLGWMFYIGSTAPK